MHFSHIFTRASLCIGLVLAAACSATAPSESSEASQSAIVSDGGGSVITLASPAFGAFGIASDGTNVYWMGLTSAGWSLNVCAIGGCGGQPTVLASGPPLPYYPGFPMALAIDATDVYFTVPGATSAPSREAERIMKCPKSGCDNDPTVLAWVNGGLSGFAVDANNVYWAVATDVVGDQPCSGGSCIGGMFGAGILECAKTGCGGGLGAKVLASTQLDPENIVSDGTTVYWSTGYGTGTGVVQCAAAGCNNNPTLLVWASASAPEYVLPAGMAVDATNLYFQDAYGTPRKCAKTGCNQTATALTTWTASGSLGYGLAIDATSLYWVGGTGTEPVNPDMPYPQMLYRCALSGCGSTPTVLWSTPESSPEAEFWARGIAVDGHNVYWTTLLSPPTAPPPRGEVFELPLCIPTTTCRSMSKTCGEWTDNCGVSQNCGTCEGDTACIEGQCKQIVIKCNGLCQ
jgi:hypothetical protein